MNMNKLAINYATFHSPCANCKHETNTHRKQNALVFFIYGFANCIFQRLQLLLALRQVQVSNYTKYMQNSRKERGEIERGQREIQADRDRIRQTGTDTERQRQAQSDRYIQTGTDTGRDIYRQIPTDKDRYKQRGT